MKRLLQLAIVLTISLFIMNATPVAFAATICGEGDNTPSGQVLQGTGQAGSDCTGAGVTNIAGKVVQILSLVVGIIAVIMIIVAGFKYITSGGDSSRIASAKTTLIYALVGLVIAAAAQFLVHFTLNSASNATSCPSGQTMAKDGTCK